MHKSTCFLLVIGSCLDCLTPSAVGEINPMLAGSWPGFARGPAFAVAVSGTFSGTYAYVAAGGLQVVAISDPGPLQLVGGCATGENATGVALAGNYAYVVDSSTGLHVVDVSDPAKPTRVGALSLSDRAQGVAVAGDYAFVAASWGGLQVIDVSDRGKPRGVGGVAGGQARSVALAGNYAYLAAGDAGLKVVDVSDPSHPQVTGSFDGGGYHYGGGSELRILRIDDRSVLPSPGVTS